MWPLFAGVGLGLAVGYVHLHEHQFAHLEEFFATNTTPTTSAYLNDREHVETRTPNSAFLALDKGAVMPRYDYVRHPKPNQVLIAEAIADTSAIPPKTDSEETKKLIKSTEKLRTLVNDKDMQKMALNNQYMDLLSKELDQLLAAKRYDANVQVAKPGIEERIRQLQSEMVNLTEKLAGSRTDIDEISEQNSAQWRTKQAERKQKVKTAQEAMNNANEKYTQASTQKTKAYSDLKKQFWSLVNMREYSDNKQSIDAQLNDLRSQGDNVEQKWQEDEVQLKLAIDDAKSRLLAEQQELDKNSKHVYAANTEDSQRLNELRQETDRLQKHLKDHILVSTPESMKTYHNQVQQSNVVLARLPVLSAAAADTPLNIWNAFWSRLRWLVSKEEPYNRIFGTEDTEEIRKSKYDTDTNKNKELQSLITQVADAKRRDDIQSASNIQQHLKKYQLLGQQAPKFSFRQPLAQTVAIGI